MKNAKFVVLAILGLAVLGIGLVVSRRGTQFDTRQRASTPSGTAQMTLVTDSTSRFVGDIFPVKVMLNTHDTAVSAAAFRFLYPINATGVADLEVVDQDSATPGVQITSGATALGSGLSTAVNSTTISTIGSQRYVYIDFSATTVNITGFKNNADELLATITFKVNAGSGTKNIEHGAGQTKVTKLTDGSDILLTIPTFVLTLATDTQAPTVTITDGPSVNSTLTVPKATFKWTGTDNPPRVADTTVPLTFATTMDVATRPTVFTATGSAEFKLYHGAHTFRVWGKDAQTTANFSTPTSPDSQRLFTVDLTPTITSVTPTHAPKGATITITGNNFAAQDVSPYQWVYFGTTPIASNNTTYVVSWTNTQIVIKIPPTANGTTLKVVVGRNVAPIVQVSSAPATITYDSMLQLFFKPQGFISDVGTKKVYVTVKKVSTATYIERFTNVDATYDAAKSAYKVLVGPLTLPVTTAAADYTVSVDDFSRLRKKFTAVTLTPLLLNDVIRTATADLVKVADLNANVTNNQPDFDNKLDIEDFGLLMSNFHQLTNPVTVQNAKYDLNGDGVIDISDIGLLLSNYTQLETVGNDE